MKHTNNTYQFRMQWLVLSVALSLVALIGWIDYAVSWEFNLFIIYSLPILLVVWQFGWRTGLVFSLLCATTSWMAQIGSNPYPGDIGFAMAVFSRLFYFVVLVVAAVTLKDLRQQGLTKIERLERAQLLERSLLQVSEREQQRIGRDLHDSLGPHLAAIGYSAGFLADDLRRLDQPEAAQAEQIRVLISDAISLTRDLVRGIFPVQMDGSGLSIALEDLADTATRLTGVTITFCETGEIQVGDPEQSMHLYRIAREAVNNAVKHGSAKKITITLRNSENNLLLAVTDDGKGMAPSSNDHGGMGLHTMRYRARMLGGDLKINSIANEGTIVSCEIPSRSLLMAAYAS